MRIPSDFNDDNLYPRRSDATSASGAGPSAGHARARRVVGQQRSTTTRRLLRLVVGLVLVMFLMRHASRPEIYEVFFAEPLQPTLGEGPAGVPEVERREPLLYPADAAKFATAERVATSLSEDDQVRVLAADTWSALDSDFLASLELDEPRRRSFATLQMACLGEAMNRVIDGSVWRGKDLDALYAALIHRELIAAASRVKTGVVPLLQQPEVYRGRAVSMLGQVVRGERFMAAENTFGIGPYWQLWLHPVDGSERPIVAVVRTLPASLESRLTLENDDEMIPLAEAPRVQIDGLYLKRLAYRSAEGAALAPAIVGYIAAAAGGDAKDPTLSAENIGIPESPAMSDSRTWLTLVATALLGFGGALLLMLRVNYTVRKLRAIRRNKRNKELSWLSRTDD